jgi:hypothetical protein
MMKHALTFAVVSLLMTGCGGNEQGESETPGTSESAAPVAAPAPAASTKRFHAESCTTTKQGGPPTCQDYAAWKKATIAYCQSIGQTAAQTQPQDTCDAAGQNFSAALMTCCR